MIVRIWRGWTTPANADAYERLLNEEIATGIVARGIPGLRDLTVLRRALRDDDGRDTEVEFVTVMRFDGLDAVIGFAGEDYEAAVVPPAAQALLSRWDHRSAHYDLRATHTPGP